MANGNGGGEASGERAARLYGLLRPHLDERQRRLLLGAEALELGRGGIKAVAEATGVHPDTVGRGVREAEGRPEPRVRAPGGGRKKLADTDQQLVPALMALVDPAARGDPVSPLRWTCLSTRNLAGALAKAGHPVTDRTVARRLREQGYSLQGNAKVAEGTQPADRDARFRYISDRAGEFLAAGDPVVSVDAKKKEKAGNFANGGAEWRPEGQPERVNVHDFPSDAVGKAIPYGTCDLGANTGWVSVGTDHDTSAFAAATLRRWWRAGGPARYPGRATAADLRRLRRVQRRPCPGLEGGARQAGRPDRAGDHRVPLPARHLQVEQGRAPAVRPDHPQLARPAADQPPGRHRADRRHHHSHRADRHRRAGHQRTGSRPAHRQARLPSGLELHRPARTPRDTCTVAEAGDTPVKHHLFIRDCLVIVGDQGSLDWCARATVLAVVSKAVAWPGGARQRQDAAAAIALS